MLMQRENAHFRHSLYKNILLIHNKIIVSTTINWSSWEFSIFFWAW